ncbi:MAG TPA: hypothetical protein PK559_02030 [Ignavibacteriaceae bacterium]|nr:hypothetical protein [Ignavibacteriaceae bacterium]
MFSLRKIVIFLSIGMIVLSVRSLAQDKSRIDSLINFVINTHQNEISDSYFAFQLKDSSENKVHKCGFGASVVLHSEFNQLDENQQKLVGKVQSRPTLDTSIVSPQNLFRIHFRKSGTSAPQYDVNEFAKACDSSYNYEVNFLGYPPPPNDGGAGGDDKYDVYILDLSGLYGYTQPEIEVVGGSKTFISYIVVDNDFAGYYTRGIDAARVTIAHEFHHAIQMGNYIVRVENETILDEFFYEITSTAMEEFVYDSINDYYAYMRDNSGIYFNYTDKAFSKNDGYNLAIWNIFLNENFGFEILKRQWELMRDNNLRALQAIDKSLLDINSNYGFLEALSTFNIWTFFSGHRAESNKYFKESNSYPQVKIKMGTVFSGGEKSISSNINPAASSFICFVNSSNLDSVVVALVNSDIEGAISAPSSTINLKYTLYNYNSNGSFKITDNYFAKLETSQPSLWSTAEFINNELAKDGSFTSREIGLPYPSPFFYSKSNYLNFPLEKTINSSAELFVYSISMDLVYSSVLTVDFAKKRIRWNAKDNSGNKLPSGIYIYFINQKDNSQKGKFVILND